MKNAFALFLLALLQAVIAEIMQIQVFDTKDCSGDPQSDLSIAANSECIDTGEGRGSLIYECAGVKSYSTEDCTGTETVLPVNECSGSCDEGTCVGNMYVCEEAGAASSVEVGVFQGMALLGAGAVLFNQ
jgi:hypothetical protein